MTTPPPAPFSPPDQAGLSGSVASAFPQAAPVVPPGYAPTQPGYASTQSVDAAPPAASPQAASAVAQPTRPTSMWLTLEGAAGSQFAIYNLDKNRPDLYIDGVPAKRDMNGYFKVPMANGKKEKLKVRATVPGYPTLKFRGKVLYKSPKPPVMTRIAYVVPALGAMILVAGWWNVLIGAVAAVGAGYGAATWLRQARDKRGPYFALIGGGVFAAALGMVGFMIKSMLGGS